MSRTWKPMLAAWLAAALVFGAVAPAFAAPVAEVPGRAAAARGASTGGIRPTALPPGWAEMDLPPGAQLKSWAPSGGGRTVWVPMYAGMSAHFEMRGAAPLNWLMALWNGYIDPENPLEADGGAHTPLVINYTAGQVTGDYGDGTVRTWDWGWYPLDVYRPASNGSFTLSWSISDPPVTKPVHRVSGADRYSTSVETAKWAFGSTATDTVVIATGKNFPDALAASALCGSWNAPLLLTSPTALPGAVTEALDTFNVKRVFLIGGTGAISSGIEQAIDAMPGVETSRVAGVDRFDTAVKIAQKVREHDVAMGRTPSTEAFLASGANFPDALAVSPYAYSQRIPILLTKAAVLSPATRNALAPLGIDTIHVVGGIGSVGGYAYDQIPSGIAKDRSIAGSDRTHTSSLAAQYAVGRGWASFSKCGLSTGWNFPDALGGGVAMGQQGGVLLLTKFLYLSAYPYHAMQPYRASISDVAVFGGTGTVGGCVLGDLNAMLNEPL